MARPPSPLTKFIRSLPVDLPVKDALVQAKAAGHETSESNVSRVRADMVKATPKKAGSKRGASPTKKAASKNVPSPKDTEAQGTAKSAGVSKSEFIRLHPSLTTAEVIAAGKDQGLSFTSSLVYAVRGAKAGKAATKKPTPKKTPASKTSAARQATASKDAAPSKSEFIRDLPLTLSAKDVVAQAKAAGIKFDDTYVYKIRRAAEKKGAGKPVVNKMASKKAVATSKETPAPKPVGTNGSRPSGSASSVEDLLRAVAAELGLGRAMEILEGERARVRRVIGQG